ncbi:glutamine synthetase family protein [Nocardioides nitrophenolicus]|uniref:glutamine synthetase family protein n=1 Tax=Nocardioides nitrophenolicus TaxID=60489 RepID=UPI001958057C|nr:glutamine synthetase family protein [Nocardioides nitrophenolicus]MBM7515993.1 glutamine synthetase [Nocardioides nitrophenolicus]
MTRNDRHLTLDRLRTLIGEGSVDTVVVAFTDMQGRLQGKRLHGQYFLDVVLAHGTEGCNYLLGVDIEMNTVDGYAMTSWERGYGDMEFVPDFDTLRLLPHLPATALVQCDLTWPDHRPVAASPRAILRAQLDRAAALGYTALAGTELEFILFEDSYESASDRRYVGLTPANQYNVDYSILGGTRIEPVIRDIRNAMYGAGMNVEGSKGECNLGQHEIGFLYDEALVTADNHAVYKTAAKEIAAAHGKSLTFMAKYDQREGNSCHIHLSLRGTDGSLVFWDEAAGTRSALYDSFVAGVLDTMPDLTLLYAPNVNSYKRFADGSFAPTTIAWGEDNRTCAVRLVGRGAGARMENRVPGGDVNPYLALAAMLAGGLHGIEKGLELEPALVGNAYASDRPRVPGTLRDARDAFRDSAVARAALGDEVVDHYTNMADVELAAFDAAVTDWELRRSFERM